MATPPSHQKKRKPKRQSIDSPGINKRQGHQWVPLPHKTHLLVPSNKLDKHMSAENADKDIFLIFGENTNSWPSGVVDKSTNKLYVLSTGVDKIELNEHIPLRSDSIFIHPDTMKTCGLVIASPVVVRRCCAGKEQKNRVAFVCRAWPLAHLPLDVVVLGTIAVLCCHGTCSEGGSGLEISALDSPSKVKVAGEIEVEPCEKLDFSINESFKSYLLHMHDGHFVCCDNLLSVSFCGEERIFKIVSIHPLVEENNGCTSMTSTMETNDERDVDTTIAEKMSGLAIGSKEEVEQKLERESPLQVFKITARSKITVVEDSKEAEESGRPSFSDVAGLEKHIQLFKELVLYPLDEENVTDLKFPRGVLLHGPAGVGKSLLAQALAYESKKAHFILLSLTEVLLGSHDSEGAMQLAFKEARERAPSLILIDDLHLLCPHHGSSPSENERKATASLSACLDNLNRHPPPAHVVVIATTNQIEGVEPSLRRPGKFDYEIEIPVPTAAERREILNVLLSGMEHSISSEQLTQLADSAHGHVGADLYAMCLEAQHCALHRTLVEGGRSEGGRSEGVRISMSDMQHALRKIRPSAMREVAVEVPKVQWSDIGGQGEVKQRMREAVEWPLKHPEAFTRLGICPPKGVLLYGPPGCSKTMIARALATESGLNFIAVKGPELFSKWVGDSERAVRQVFSRARAAAPSIIFFDEIDALAVQRKSEGGSAVADRVLAQLLTEMDGVETLNDVLIVAATNRPDMIDKALLRPGRIDRLVYVPLPSNDTRNEIFKIQFKKMSVDSDVEVTKLVERTAGFSGAEVVSLCQEAALCAMHEDIETERVGQRHFEQALETIRPQTDPKMLEFYENYSRTT